ncbi:MAG: HAD-IA family hydrolase [Candidatus Nanoarchaeia archaeon]
MKRFKAIIFDLGGVLSIGEKEEFAVGVHEFVSKRLGLSFDQYIDSIDTIYGDAISGRISGIKALKGMAKNLNIFPEKLKKIYFKAYKVNFKIDRKIYRFALKLKKEGYKIGIISDIWEIAKEALLENKYYKKFDSITASCDVGSRKTSPKIFKVSLKKLRVNPKDTIFTDNQTWNLTAPRKLGITSILYKNKKHLIGELKKLGVVA